MTSEIEVARLRRQITEQARRLGEQARQIRYLQSEVERQRILVRTQAGTQQLREESFSEGSK